MPLLVSRGSTAYSWLARLSIAFCRAWPQVRRAGVSALAVPGGTHRDAVAWFESRLWPPCCTEAAVLQQLRDACSAPDRTLELWAAVPQVPKPRCYIDKVCACRTAHSMSACHGRRQVVLTRPYHPAGAAAEPRSCAPAPVGWFSKWNPTPPRSIRQGRRWQAGEEWRPYQSIQPQVTSSKH